MEAVAVEEVVVALEPLRPLAEGPALHVCSVVLHQGPFEHHDGSLIVPVVVEPHARGEGPLWGGEIRERERERERDRDRDRERERETFGEGFSQKEPVLLKDRSDLAGRKAKQNLWE